MTIAVPSNSRGSHPVSHDDMLALAHEVATERTTGNGVDLYSARSAAYRAIRRALASQPRLDYASLTLAARGQVDRYVGQVTS